MSERYGEDAICQEPYGEIVDEMEERLKTFCRRHRIGDAVRRGDVQMLGTSGTVTTLAGVYMDLPRYDRSIVDGATLDFDEVQQVSERLRAMACEERASHPCIGAERAKLSSPDVPSSKRSCDDGRWAVSGSRTAAFVKELFSR